jgi:hypothetical protein
MAVPEIWKVLQGGIFAADNTAKAPGLFFRKIIEGNPSLLDALENCLSTGPHV